MNFLAHIYLSGNNPNVMAGNFMGDFVKGRNLAERFHPEIALGIDLHRSIDEYTDQHPVVRESKLKLRPKYRHYAPVVIDVFYDHFLSRYWHNYHSAPLKDFAWETYKVLGLYGTVFPDAVRQMLPSMIRDNWLVNYGTFEGITQALTGMARRSRHDSKMDESVVELKAHYDEFLDEFERFFPDLSNHCRHILAHENKNLLL